MLLFITAFLHTTLELQGELDIKQERTQRTLAQKPHHWDPKLYDF